MKNTLILYMIMVSFLGNAQENKKINSIKQLTDSIAIIVKNKHIPGLMLGIATKDSVLFSGGFGYANIEENKMVTNTTRFRMGSITKSFIAIAIQLLIEKGKLHLDDKLSAVAPEVPFHNKWESSHPVTIASLLENTTGFDDFKLNRMYSLEQKDYTTKQMMLLQAPSMICRWPPLERYTYCNVNYAILGYIITKLTGMEYDDYLNQNILVPLRMRYSGFDLWSIQPKSDVREYRYSGKNFVAVPSVSLLIGPAASLWSTSDDMIKFLQFFLNSGKPILTSNSLESFESPIASLSAEAGLKSGYAKGNEDFGELRGHDGSLGTCNSIYRYNRKVGYGFVISSNANGLAGIENLINNYFSDKATDKKIKTQPLDKKMIAPYLGYYQAEDPRFHLLSFVDRLMFVKIGVEKDTLVFNIMGKQHKLLQCTPLTFMQPWASSPNAIFTVNSKGHKVMVLNKHYTEKVSGFYIFYSITIVLACIIFSLTAILLGIISIGLFFMKKLNWPQLQLRLLPTFSLIFLIWGVNSFLEVKSNSYLLYELATVSYNSIAIFLGMSLFSILAILNFVLILKRFRSLKNTFLKYFLPLTALFLLLMATVLFKYGWVFLQTWEL